MTDIVARLREGTRTPYGLPVQSDEARLHVAAADEIARLRAELAAANAEVEKAHQKYVDANEARIDATDALGNMRGLLWDVDEELAGGGHLRDGKLRRRVHSAIKNIGKLLEDGEQHE